MANELVFTRTSKASKPTNTTRELLFLLYDGTLTKDNLTRQQKFDLKTEYGENYIGILNLK